MRTLFYPNGSYDIQHPKVIEDEDEDRNEDDKSSKHTRSINKEGTGAGGQGDKLFNTGGTLASSSPLPRVVGWETNER